MQKYTAIRWGRCIMYLGLFVAGILSFFFPPVLVQDQIGNEWVHVWAAFLSISSAGCMVGAMSDRWIGEYSFIPLLFTTLMLFSISAMLSANTDGGRYLTVGLIVLALCFGLIGRRQDLSLLMKMQCHRVEYDTRHGV